MLSITLKLLCLCLLISSSASFPSIASFDKINTYRGRTLRLTDSTLNGDQFYQWRSLTQSNAKRSSSSSKTLIERLRNAKSTFLNGSDLVKAEGKRLRINIAQIACKKSSEKRVKRWKNVSLYAPLIFAVVTVITHSLPAAASMTQLASAPAAAETNGFVQAFSLVFVSELGDKTFFIAALLAAKTSRFVSFVGSIAALTVMTLISCLIGAAFHNVPSSLTGGIPFDDYIAVAAFLYFGLVTLRDASKIPDDDNSGMEAEAAEAKESVKEVDESVKMEGKPQLLSLIAQTFGLVFAAEFGDRSFLTTIALSAAQNPFSVAGGAIAAHASATGIAVMGGALISKFVSEKLIGYIGGTLFIVFAFTTALGLF
mmetsp:Transcript_805/g.1178  ORF Transcript_805/g.1178 Transcript_805/m.1178 type:complete len:370 (-) Transcript_805:51-1160(-)